MGPDPLELKKQLEELNDEFDKISRSISSAASLIQIGLSKNLNSAVEDAKDLAAQFEKGKNVAKGVESQLKKNKKAIEETFLKEIKLQSDLTKAITDRNYKEQKKIKAALNDLNIQKQILYQLDAQLRLLEKINAEYQKNRNVLVFLKEKFQDLTKSAKEFFSIATLFKAIVDAGLRYNKVSVDIGKNLGYGADNANRYTKELVAAAQTSSNLNFTLQNAADAANELNTSTGYVAEYSADALETQIMLTKQFGLQADEAAGIYKLSVLTGKSSEKVNDEMVGAFVAARNQLGKAVPFKATMAEAAKVSGRLAANLQNNPATIVKAVVAAKALGTSLEQTAKQGEALLNFESSIENELKAELLTGKQLNLERARAAALAGDQVTLAQELSSQVGSLEDFQRMNVIQQKAVADAVGLTADELADQLRKQEIARKNGESLAQLTKREAKEAQARQDIQDKFNQAILKLQDLVGNLVAGPMGAFIDSLSKALDFVGKISGKIGKIGEMIKNLLGDKVSSVLGGAASVATIGALIYIMGKSLTKGTYFNPMITQDISGGGGGGGGMFDLFSGGRGGKVARGRALKGLTGSPKGSLKGLFKAGSGASKFAKASGWLSLLGAGLDLGANLSDENRTTGNAIAKTADQNKFAAGGATIGAILGGIFGFGGGAVPGAAAGGGIGGLLDMLLGEQTKIVDDMVGYGARTLITPQGAVALNNQDTVIAGTNLFKGDDVFSMPKGALNLSGGVDLTPMISAINEVRAAVEGLSNRPIRLVVDGTEMITRAEKTTSRMA